MPPRSKRAVTRDVQGKAVPYGTGDAPQLLAMCRATEWWQRRLVDLSRRAVGEWGFSGVYLDSFGKGAPECFAPDHGHPVGGGNTVISGQRVLAQRVREAVRARDPEAILSGEDPIEAFRDLLDVNLYSVNTMPNYVPVYRTVWGDYSLGHGRVLAPGKSGANLLPELATLFLEGTIPGRIYGESPDVFLLQPDHAKEFSFLQSLTAYTDHGLAWLRFGEYLHPLTFTPPPPTIGFRESVENQTRPCARCDPQRDALARRRQCGHRAGQCRHRCANRECADRSRAGVRSDRSARTKRSCNAWTNEAACRIWRRVRGVATKRSNSRQAKWRFWMLR